MNIFVKRTTWDRVSKQLPLYRNPDTPKWRVHIANWVMPLNPPKAFPRLHIKVFTSRNRFNKNRHKFVKLDIHVDQRRHTEFHSYHPKIDRIINMLHNS